MILFGLNLLLAMIWAALNGSTSLGGLFIGYWIGCATLWLARPLYDDHRYFGRIWQIISFVGFFIREMVIASWRVACDIVNPVTTGKAGIVAVPLDVETDLEIAFLANLITLTPGTVSLELSDDKRTLYVHGMFVDDVESFRSEIKTVMERRVLELLR